METTNYFYDCPKCIGITISKEEECFRCEWCGFSQEEGLCYWKEPRKLTNRFKNKDVKRVNK